MLYQYSFTYSSFLVWDSSLGIIGYQKKSASSGPLNRDLQSLVCIFGKAITTWSAHSLCSCISSAVHFTSLVHFYIFIITSWVLFTLAPTNQYSITQELYIIVSNKGARYILFGKVPVLLDQKRELLQVNTQAQLVNIHNLQSLIVQKEKEGVYWHPLICLFR